MMLFQKNKYFLIICVFFFWMGGALSAEPVIEITSYETELDFTDSPVVYIQKGDSEEYRNPDFNDSDWNVISLPSSWDDLYPDFNGICWYRIHINFPDAIPKDSLGIRLGVITDSDETYFNGQLIGSSGTVDSTESSAYDKIRLYEIPTSLIKPGQENIIAIRVRGLFSYTNGPFSGSFLIGKHGELLTQLLSRDFLDLFFVVVYFIVAAYFFLFFARRKVDHENLFFALFALAMGGYFALRTQGKYLIDADFFILKKFEYLLLSSLLLLLLEFLLSFYKKKHSIFHYIFMGMSGFHFLFFLFTNDFVLWDNYNQYIQIPTWGLGVVLSFIILISNFKKNKDARLMFYSLSILLATMINDVFLNMAFYNFYRLTSYGFLFFILAISVILSNSFVRLYREVEDLNSNLEQRVEDRTEKLNQAVALLEEAQSETDNILENVQEGIFLIDKDFIIADHHSRMLETIFEKEELGGTNLLDLIKEMADDDIAEQSGEFMELALTKKISEKRLNTLNPVDELKLEIEKNGEFIEKFVRLNFTRIGEKGNYTNLLGTVQDVSEEKVLERKIKESEEKAEEEMKLLLGILHLNPDIVGNFLDESRNEIIEIEKNLEEASFNEDLKELLSRVFRSVHSIKGNASLLELKMFANQAHEFEDRIQKLFKKKNLTSIDLLDLLYSIVGIKDALKQVEDLLKRITGFQKEFGSAHLGINDIEILKQTVQNLVLRISEREYKEINLSFDNFDFPSNSGIDIIRVKKILIQIIKNALTHGIESPEDRIAAGKNKKGNISLSSKTEKESIVFSIMDDGRGLNLDALYKKAIESGLYKEEELRKWPREKLAQLVFAKGLSTKSDSSLDAGRGIGMDVVRHEIRQAGGKISFSSKPGKQTIFTVRLPLSSA